jgi:hypothetical protein
VSEPTRDGPAPNEPASTSDEDPPILGAWPRLYAALLVYIAVLIALFTWFTRAFQ